MLRVTVAPELAGVVRLGVLAFSGARNADRSEQLDARLAAAEATARARPEADTGSVRAMYRRVGLDPTKTRPSSEALLRRVLRGGTLPRISTLVDVCNWCSLEFQLPYGLYDRARLRSDVELRLGRPGEAYAGIRKDEVHVGGRITLADAEGPFGNPTSDSARTAVTPATTEVFCAVFAPADTAPGRLASVLETTSSRMCEFTGATELERTVI